MSNRITKQEFNRRLNNDGRDDVLLIGDYTNARTKTIFKCTVEDCQHEWLAIPDSIRRGSGCPRCAGRVLIPQLNSVAALRPDLIQYFEVENEAWSVMPYSNKSVNLKCPDCGAKRVMRVCDLFKRGFVCQLCGPNISYPNRLIRSFMNQLYNDVCALQYEWSSQWTNKQRYDVYFELHKQRYVIEMQGIQHYGLGWNKDMPIEDVVAQDVEKSNLALLHGVIPIVIDARFSSFEFIIDNIYNSILSDIFDLSVIDLTLCKQDATKNIIKEICDDYNTAQYTTIQDLANKYLLNRHTIVKYLKIGSELGWCQYSSQKSLENYVSHVSKKVKVFNDKREELYVYESLSKCARELSKIYNRVFYTSNISKVCGSGRLYHGFYFEYA